MLSAFLFTVSSCKTEDVATCFASAKDGDVINLVPGTMNSTDGITFFVQFYMSDKYVTISCNEGGETCILNGATVKIVMYLDNIGGTTTLAQLIIRDGHQSCCGSGVVVESSNVNLIMCSFIDNYAGIGGAVYVSSTDNVDDIVSSTVTLQGCKFEGNTGETPADIQKVEGTVLVEECPTGYTSTRGSKLKTLNAYPVEGNLTDPSYSYTCEYVFATSAPTFAPSSAPSTAPCPAGTFGKSEPDCTNCPAGKISDTLSSPSCADCPAGHSSGEGQCSCEIDCSAGRYSTGGAPCELCEAGKFSPQLDATTSATCVDCAESKFSNQPGAISDETCKPCHGAEPGSSTCDEEPEEDDDRIELAYHLIEITCGMISLGGFSIAMHAKARNRMKKKEEEVEESLLPDGEDEDEAETPINNNNNNNNNNEDELDCLAK